jgi:hypothetical protein
MELRDTEKLRDKIADLTDKLLEGKISNAVARSAILGARFQLESLKAEMEAVRLGSSFRAVAFHEADRHTENTKLRRVS